MAIPVRRSGGRVVVIVLLMLSGLRAQAPQAAPAELPPSTIRVNTRLVLVDVVVTDKQGKPVKGLRPDDFTLEEKGKTQKVAFFTPPGEEKVSSASQLPPGIYSNKPEYRSPGGPVTVLLLDAANTPFKDQAYARQQMLQFVKEQLKPGQRMAVFTLTNSLEILTDFTSDPELLLKALQQYQPREQEMASTVIARPPSTSSDGGQRVAQATLAMAQRVRDFQNIQVAYVLDRRVQTTLSAMRSLSRILEGIPGRKNVVWVTAAFPFSLIPEDRVMSEAEMAESMPTISQLGVGTRASGSVASTQRQSHAQEIREAASELANAQVAIYPVDARGLISGMEATIEDGPARRIDDPVDAATLRISDVTASQETMREMARETGGVAYVNQNDIKNGATLAANDSAASYTLGYYPSDKKWDGKYRSIKVKLNHDGTDVRYRRGYFAIDPSQIKNRNSEQEVAQALQDSAPDTQVTFSAQVKPGDKGKVGIDFLIDANTVSTEDASNGKHVNMSIYAASFGKDGRMLANLSQKVDQTFPADTFQQILKQGMLMHMDLDAPAGATELRLAVFDNRTGHVGTLRAEPPPGH